MPIETVEPGEARPGDMKGRSVQRREDRSLLTGDARYTDDIDYRGQVYLALLGSQHAHARVEDVDTSAAEAAEDVVAVYTYEDLLDADIDGTLPAADLEAEDIEGSGEEGVTRTLLADRKVRYQGQPVAAVLAEERYAAFDALDDIDVTYDTLDAVVDHETADEAEPTVHEAAPNNVATEWETGDADATAAAFENAAHTVEVAVGNNRLVPTAIEPRAAVAQYRPGDDELVVELSSQNPHSVQSRLTDALGVPRHRVTVRVPDVGGGFGAKLQPYTGHVLAAWAAMRHERPVKWQARRRDDFLSMVHARKQTTTIAAALDEDGRIRALDGHIDADVGGYPTAGGVGIPKGTATMLCGAYDVPTAHVSVRGLITTTAPLSAYRGAGRPEATYIVERLVNACARELDVDPVAFRRRNFLDPGQFPVETPLDATYDSGEYDKPLTKVLETIDYESFRERQREAREEGRYLGVGLSSYVEVCGGSEGAIESGVVRVNADGGVTVATGTQDTGQGHGTSYAQVVSDELGVPLDDVEVVEGDTDTVTEGGGTAGSRSLAMAGNALAETAGDVREKATRVAAHQLEADAADVEFDDGSFHVTGAPRQSVSLQEVATAAYDPGELPEDVEPGLEASGYFEPSGSTAPFGTHACVVEVDPATGDIDVERYVAVDDVGTQVNPKLVEGQVVGGVIQGIGQARYEEGHYDDNGNLVTASLQDYGVPKAHQVPEVEWDSTVTESPHNPLGVKGVGEAGTIGATPTLVNAALDALAPLGVERLEMPLSPESVWQAIEDARED